MDNYLALEDFDTDEESGQEKCIGMFIFLHFKDFFLPASRHKNVPLSLEPERGFALNFTISV